MKISIKNLRKLISEVALQEYNTVIKGKLRQPGRGPDKKQQFNPSYVESENRELGLGEVETLFPGAIDAWSEIVPDVFPDFPYDDPNAIKNVTLWFKIGNQLRASFTFAPTVELAYWDPKKEDWIEMDYASGSSN